MAKVYLHPQCNTPSLIRDIQRDTGRTAVRDGDRIVLAERDKTGLFWLDPFKIEFPPRW